MALPVSFYSQTYADNTIKSNGQVEKSGWTVAVANLTAANVVAQDVLIGTLGVAIDAILLGVRTEIAVVFARQHQGTGPSSNPLAQRENKFLIRYHGATLFKKFNISIPTADLTKLMTNSEFVDVTSGPGQAIKTAWELVVVSPDDAAEATILDSIQFVGRNS
jgi:hypothetical protein